MHFSTVFLEPVAPSARRMRRKIEGRRILGEPASADPPALSEGQVSRPGERHPPLAEVVWHPLGKIGREAFDLAVRQAVADDPLSSELMDAMLSARAALWKQYCRLHDLVVIMGVRSEPCRRFMAIPAVGPVTALSFMTAIDDPTRFRRSRDVAAYFGLISRRWAVRHLDRRSGPDLEGRRRGRGRHSTKRRPI